MLKFIACASSADVQALFLMDVSGSLGETNWQVEQRFVSDMITTGISYESSVSVVTFGSGAWSHWNFTDTQQPRSMITDMVENLAYIGGSTYMKTAIRTAITLFDNNESGSGDKILMFITDGDPFPSYYESVCDNNAIKRSLDNSGL